MLGAGTVINPIIKIVTTVAILAAVYFFIVKPTLDTTNHAFDSFSDSFSGFDDLPGQIQDDIDSAFDSTGGSQDLRHCLERAINGAGSNQERIQRCVGRFG